MKYFLVYYKGNVKTSESEIQQGTGKSLTDESAKKFKDSLFKSGIVSLKPGITVRLEKRECPQ